MPENRLALRGPPWRRPRGYVDIEHEDESVDDVADDEIRSIADSTASRSVDLSSNGEMGISNLLAAKDSDVFLERSRIFDDIANKHLQPSETDLMIQKFRRQIDIPFSRAYRFGQALREDLPHTVVPIVGLVFLPGADLPEVTRLEGHDMLEESPDQRDARWRVSTAASLLSVSFVGRDLSVVTLDVTSDVARHTRLRLQNGPIAKRPQKHDLDLIRGDAVTLDSEKILLCHELSNHDLDVCATLVEVNASALMALVFDYRHIISTSGPTLTHVQGKDLLDHATDIRYGIDNEQGFQTFTTSKGIQELVMMSSSYFNSLDPSAPGMTDSTQREIRPRFLQMLTLLLSLLNDRDLSSMSEFVERTYGINPKRQELELLFCKVIPLTSINPKVFLQALIPAIDDINFTIRDSSKYKQHWETLLWRLARKGYLLPGSLEDLGHPHRSWIVMWPDVGIRSSTAFGRLQLHGEKTSTFNEIPQCQFHYEPGLKTLTVLLTNSESYTIHPDDHDRISTLTAGHFDVTSCEDASICGLLNSEVVLNRDINEAIRVINVAIRQFNARSTPSGKSVTRSLLRKRAEPLVFPDLEAAARLTRNQAVLQPAGTILAVAYKLDGKNIPKAEALRHMSDQYTRAMTLFGHLCESARRSVSFYERYIGDVHRFFGRDRQVHAEEKKRPTLSDSPIARAFHTADNPLSRSTSIWYSYWVEIRHHQRAGRELLHIGAKCDLVSSIVWRHPGQQAEIRLAQVETIFFVSPLTSVREDQQHEEVRVGDMVLLAGRYIIVVAPDARDASMPCIMQNWMEIQEALSSQHSRRGQNMRSKEPLPIHAVW
ncbi:hypothetical protein LTR02_002084 [Friedmanniomyces endolithicus]|nr:hypothetical protein LTR94_001991 [Friedmanniomyces endolithicus]KAK0808427.1 hypothetical protein LTR38_004542 [Friedmanniomyces endolithicus]KAK0811830.1 hypothetical protein LTR59_001768 [Friedmanniomyces endolithicus]KAK0857372.1 hypothetical protein LTR03_000862 [Friedmanniomyces endolithicus]KAK0913805.1 hypothetical protein LTR02_002084 [Friedmanniomyces endolithicus]